MRTGTSKTVQAYITAAPAPARKMLKELRAAVRSVAPRATEKISYGIPYYDYFGRLTYFAAFKNHVSLYVMGAARKVYAQELKKYQTSMATLRFPIGSRVPVALVKKVVRFRVKENESARGKKR
jgi:uncharacterized protein YdhG (YjbR/CyaY superfamily)